MDLFRPDIYAKDIYSINYSKLKKSGIKCLIFDLDNTIAPKTVQVPSKEVKSLFLKLEEMGFSLAILSNSKKSRVEPFKEQLNVNSAYYSKKPFKTKYLKVMNMYHLKDTEIACIGDQLLTDIFGANKLYFTSILVNPITHKEGLPTSINRFFERKIFKHFKKKGIFHIGEYYD